MVYVWKGEKGEKEKMNPKLKFVFDEEKDLRNIWETVNFKSRFKDFSKNMPEKWVKICQDKEFSECKDILKKELNLIYKSKTIVYFIQAVETYWKKIEEEYFKRLEKITKKELNSDNITVYITTVGRCPYDNKNYSWFFISYFFPVLGCQKTIGHELMHFNFHEFFWNDIEKQLGKDKTSDLKEALTVLLNLEFNDLWFVNDNGYELHKELREFIIKEWSKEKNFVKLLNKCVDYLKER